MDGVPRDGSGKPSASVCVSQGVRCHGGWGRYTYDILYICAILETSEARDGSHVNLKFVS